MLSNPLRSMMVERLRGRGNRWTDIYRLLGRAGAPLVLTSLLLSIALGLLPAAFMLSTSALLDRIPSLAQHSAGASWGNIIGVFCAAIGAFGLQQLLAPFQTAVTEIVARQVDERCIGDLLDLTLRTAAFAVLEDPEHADLIADARAAFAHAAATPGDAAAALPLLVARYCGLAAAVVLVGAVLTPFAALLLAATALAVRFGVRGTLGRYAALWDSLTRSRRQVGYVSELATGTVAAKEIRVLNLMPWLRDRLHQETIAGLLPLWKGSRRLQFWPFIVFSALGFAVGSVVLVLLAVSAADGRTSLLGLAVVLQAVLVTLRFGVAFPECDVPIQFGLHSFHAFDRLVLVARTGAGLLMEPGVDEFVPPQREIEFEDVSFAYTEDGPRVLDGLSLRIPVGKCTAIVGLNGAGKTTLVKLLARLYDPTEGRVLIDGVNLCRYAPAVWQRWLAVLFQDYVRYELSAMDNIGLGAPGLLDHDSAVRDAAERAGAARALADLPEGLHTPLSRNYPGGRDLSGGQWQRVALARALLAVRGGAGLLVLDEPTAQLDVRAEVEFFERFLATAQGLTSVIISHRFSTVRHADQIVVVEHGRVLERGTHASLIRDNGRYAELFRLQAERFHHDEQNVSVHP
ncbi:ATP-binding cassette subfamily B protein [Streptomyces sp. 846.5]|nr:ATP-binding cassette domain-containing protein [Streptomyces sp. 846.5]TDU04463.1 ATP-binding cassette subfamily B protein [Streptomyces sp. 846.5]